MNYCALDDAFQTIGGAPSPGCAADYATKMARKEERRKARRCKGPAAAYLDIEDKDPDRPSTNMAPPVPVMNSESGLREHMPVTAPQGTTEAFTHGYASEIPDQRKPNFDQDPMYNYLKDEMTKHLIPVRAPTTETLKPSMRKKFFGADPDGDLFADYEPDAQETLYPDFRKTFEQTGAARAGALPTPSVDMYWKPLTTAGAQTSFVEHLPPPGGKYQRAAQDPSMDEVMKKMDKLFARLDDMNTSSPEQVTSELLMFISSGIFVLFMMDLLVKKGSTLRF